MTNLESIEKKGFLQKVPGFRSNVWWKKVIAVIGYLIIIQILVSIFSTSDSKKTTEVTNEEKDIQQEQQAEISRLKNEIIALNTKIDELKKDPTIAFREAMDSNDKKVIAAFVESFPDQTDLVQQAENKITQIESEEKQAEAKRKAEEEAAQEKREQELKERGTSAGEGFYYKNVSFKSHTSDTIKVMGEIRNVTGQDWEAVFFNVSVYSPSDKLLESDSFSISNFNNGTTKSFYTFIDDNVDGEFKYRIQFENGF